jgi:hypothetical protein
VRLLVVALDGPLAAFLALAGVILPADPRKGRPRPWSGTLSAFSREDLRADGS